MNYQTFRPHRDLEGLIKCYWTLEVPIEPVSRRQRILPDGCIEMIFILGDDVKRYTSKNKYVLQPRAMVLGQISKPFFVEPTGAVNSFAIRFYPYGFANFTTTPIKALANKETPIKLLFGKKMASDLERRIVNASGTRARIDVIEKFLRHKLKEKTVVDHILKSAIEALLSAQGAIAIHSLLKGTSLNRRQLERKFSKQVGISPKQLGKVIRLQAVLKMLLNKKSGSLTNIAYETQYYDQAHFIKDFREFTGISPKEFFKDDELALSSLIYSKD